jgi:hypothetical protein
MENLGFKIGDKVVCINDHFDKSKSYSKQILKWPELMEIYTIRDFYDKSIYLEEIVNPIIIDNNKVIREPCFYRWRFIKLDLVAEEEFSCSEAWSLLFEE